MYDIKSMDRATLGKVFRKEGLESFRAAQVFRWLWRGARSYSAMTDLPKSLRETLERQAPFAPPELLRRQSTGDGTEKFLWKLSDGNAVETVLMRYKHGVSACISSQVGCRMGCRFCASADGGLVRGLLPSEMLDQVLFSGIEAGVRVSNVVLMGIGEPLDNLDNVLAFLAILNDPEGLNIGMRHVSLSTCGIQGGIERLMEENLQLTLSVSLHAPDDETRSQLMPANRALGVEPLIRLCRRYFERTGRRISFEYALIDGVNDSDAAAEKLSRLIRGMPAHVNLIPLNTVEGTGLAASPPARVRGFQERLRALGVNATVRRKMGAEIDAACGQLRRRAGGETEKARQKPRRG
ncbi:23S rRNA (adenine(2503)-C(2))-methyltransferase RlmN [Oscillospiraceae bacterium OttesenSCG-928-F05]|nr:23S rRNA (adenine(2503)-C(2))-methyltransferase RlmN [Oscillospiraceae bacterium OttesenSCG-928-F05]